MRNKVILVCGVSGSGKTWICEQLKHKFEYVPHDQYYDDIVPVIVNIALGSNKPIITEVPFAERPLRDALQSLGFDIFPVFVIEDAEVVSQRYLAREGKPIQKSAYTRASTIIKRAEEWGSPHGTSQEVLEYLQGLVFEERSGSEIGKEMFGSPKS